MQTLENRDSEYHINTELGRIRQIVNQALSTFGDYYRGLGPLDKSYAIFRAHIRTTPEKSIIYDLTRFHGKLSTDPRRVGSDITPKSFRDNEDIIAMELNYRLDRLNFQNEIKTNPTAYREHPFLFHHSNALSSGPIIIDPTIGLFLREQKANGRQQLPPHNHVFVGTPGQLKDALYTYAQALSLYGSKGNRLHPKEVEVFYQDVWGKPISGKTAA